MNHNRVELGLKAGKKDIYFKGCNVNLSSNPESEIAATLLPSMVAKRAFLSPKYADEQFLASIDQIQDIFSTWDDQFSKNELLTKPKRENVSGNNGVGAFFTAGVDSYYTFLKNNEEISHIIYVYGLDIGLNEKKLREKVSKTLYKIASHFGKELIEIETNLRWFSDQHVYWGMYHGAALAAIGHYLKYKLHKIYIPSSHTYKHMFPWGSNALTDPLWSSSELQFVHNGSEATRIQKAALISKSEIAMNTLRVCWKNSAAAYNCGECEKCVRTMINLKAVGALKRCSVFPDSIPLSRVMGLRVKSKSTRSFINENINALKKKRDDRALIWALKWTLLKPQIPDSLRRTIHEFISRFRIKK